MRIDDILDLSRQIPIYWFRDECVMIGGYHQQIMTSQIKTLFLLGLLTGLLMALGGPWAAAPACSWPSGSPCS